MTTLSVGYSPDMPSSLEDSTHFQFGKDVMRNKLYLLAVPLISIGFLAGYFLYPAIHEQMLGEKGLDEMRTDFIVEKEQMIGEMMAHGDYRCCLEKPCVYCIEKSPGHGEDATCNCLEDVVNGRHPCGECIGEILEGHGNRFLAEYFAAAIAEEVAEKHSATGKEISSEKYDIAVEEQI